MYRVVPVRHRDLRGNGSFWSQVTVTTNDTRAIWGFAHNDIFSAVDILHWNGAQSSQVANPALSVVKLWGAARDDLWGVGPANTIYHWGDGVPGGEGRRPERRRRWLRRRDRGLLATGHVHQAVTRQARMPGASRPVDDTYSS